LLDDTSHLLAKFMHLAMLHFDNTWIRLNGIVSTAMPYETCSSLPASPCHHLTCSQPGSSCLLRLLLCFGCLATIASSHALLRMVYSYWSYHRHSTSSSSMPWAASPPSFSCSHPRHHFRIVHETHNFVSVSPEVMTSRDFGNFLWHHLIFLSWSRHQYTVTYFCCST
jgi:hypothetical protein